MDLKHTGLLRNEQVAVHGPRSDDGPVRAHAPLAEERQLLCREDGVNRDLPQVTEVESECLLPDDDGRLSPPQLVQEPVLLVLEGRHEFGSRVEG